MVLGCNGQDGTFLCRRLVAAKCGRIVGVGIETTPRFDYDPNWFRYVSLDLAGSSAELRFLLEDVRPERVFHVAAVHASAEFSQYEPVFEPMLAVNVRSVYTILEHIRTVDASARLIYASSAKVFGSPLPPVVNEESPRSSTCRYSTAKNAGGAHIRYYRHSHGTQASQLYLFNHESELRPRGFFVPKLVDCLRAALRGEQRVEHFQTLDFYCDWGSADEYMGIMIEAVERAPGEDFVVATGRTVHARTLAEQLFAHLDDPMHDYVSETVEQTGAHPYIADIAKLKAAGLAPKLTIEALLERLASQAPT